MDKCDIVFKEKISESNKSSVFFGIDSEGRDVAIKSINVINKQNLNEIDLAIRISNDNIIKAYSVLLPGTCDIENILILYEICLYDLQHYIDYEEKSPVYFKKSKKFALGLVNGLSFLHQNDIYHSEIDKTNILIKINDKKEYTAVLSDLYNCVKEPQDDSYYLGLIFLELFTFKKYNLEDNINEYIQDCTQSYWKQFRSALPFSGLLFGRKPEDYTGELEKIKDAILNTTIDQDVLLECVFILGKMEIDSFKYFMYYLHNLYRYLLYSGEGYPEDIVNNVIQFTNYVYDKTEEIDPELLIYFIELFEGVIKPNTMFDSYFTEQEIIDNVYSFFDLNLYFRSIYEKNNNIEDIFLTEELKSIINNPEKYIKI